MQTPTKRAEECKATKPDSKRRKTTYAYQCLVSGIHCNIGMKTSFVVGIYCICVVHIYKSYPRCRTFILNQIRLLVRVGLRVGKRKEQDFKSMLGNVGYSENASDEIWKWYTAPTREAKNSDNQL